MGSACETTTLGSEASSQTRGLARSKRHLLGGLSFLDRLEFDWLIIGGLEES